MLEICTSGSVGAPGLKSRGHPTWLATASCPSRTRDHTRAGPAGPISARAPAAPPVLDGADGGQPRERRSFLNRSPMRRDLPGFRVPPCACAVLYDPGEISAARDARLRCGRRRSLASPTPAIFLSRLNRTASRSLCTLRSRRHRRTTQHSVPAGSLLLAGQVHLLLGHNTRFQLCFTWHPPRPSSSGAQ
jgi:hypothetical protein